MKPTIWEFLLTCNNVNVVFLTDCSTSLYYLLAPTGCFWVVLHLKIYMFKVKRVSKKQKFTWKILLLCLCSCKGVEIEHFSSFSVFINFLDIQVNQVCHDQKFQRKRSILWLLPGSTLTCVMHILIIIMIIIMIMVNSIKRIQRNRGMLNDKDE